MSKRAGAVPAETKAAILAAAKQEFSREGFSGSSLRRIAAAAGVTTGAVYFFFRGKDDLFETVLAEVTEPFSRMMQEHYRSEDTALGAPGTRPEENDLAVSRQLIDFYFAHQQTFDILLAHLGHPSVQRFIDRFADGSTEHYLRLIARAGEARPRRKPADRFAVHQFVHMQTDAMLTLISHGFTREEMAAHAKAVTGMLHAAFGTLLEE